MAKFVQSVEEQGFQSQQMSESTPNEKKYQRVREYLNNLDDFQKLYEQCVVSEYVEEKLKRREPLRRKARGLIEEYNDATDEEQGEIEKRRNREGRYTIDQLKEISNMSDEDMVPEEAEDYDVPARFAGSDVQARSVSEVREIMSCLMDNYDPVDKGAPNWNQTKKDLKGNHDIHTSTKKLKRYWTAIEEKEAFNLVREKLYWEIAGEMEETTKNLLKHINNRVGSEGGEYDSMKERVEALEKIAEIIQTLSGGKSDQEVEKQGTTVKQEFKFTELEEAKRDDNTETIEVEESGSNGT